MTKRMREGEWMPEFGDDFWGSERVAAMSDSAVLLYRWLLWRQWVDGDLPQPDVLRRLAPRGWGGPKWPKLWAEVAGCFDVLASGRLANARCAEEREIAFAIRASTSARASAGGHAKAARARAKAELEHRSGSASSVPQAGPEHASGTSRATTEACPKHAPGNAPALHLTSPDQTGEPPVAPRGGAPHSIATTGEPEHEQLAWWCGEWRRRKGVAYPVVERRDLEALRAVIAAAFGNLDDVRRAMIALLDDAYWNAPGRGYDLRTLRKNFASLLGASATKPALKPAAPLPAPKPQWEIEGFPSREAWEDHHARESERPENRRRRCAALMSSGIASLRDIARTQYPQELADLERELANEPAELVGHERNEPRRARTGT